MANTFTNYSDSSSTSSSCLSDDEEDNDSPVRQKRIRLSNYVETVVISYSGVGIKTHFRMTRTTAYKIIGKVN